MLFAKTPKINIQGQIKIECRGELQKGDWSVFRTRGSQNFILDEIGPKSYYYNTKIHQNMKQEGFDKADSLRGRKGTKSLLVEIKIKNKVPTSLMIEDITDEALVDQSIKGFMTTNHLKQEAFSYIKTIVLNKIRTTEEKSSSTSKVEHKPHLNKENQFTYPLQSSHKRSNACHNTAGLQNIQVNLRSSRKHLQFEKESPFKESTKPDPLAHKDILSVFSSSFTLPSSQENKERDLLTDMKFEHVFDTVGKHSEDFSTINEFEPDRATSARPLYLTPALGKPLQSKPRKPIKIRLSSRIKKNLPEEEKKSPSFEIYETQVSSGGDELGEQVSRLFEKLTRYNPMNLRGEVKSQYVSYQDLSKGELKVVGKLFERIDPMELPHLNFQRFKSNLLSICKEQLSSLSHKYHFPQPSHDLQWKTHD